MEQIVVSGATRGIGKTSLIGNIIQNLRDRVGVIKTSMSVDRGQRLVSNKPEIIEKPDTDTATFKEAGATEVVFIQTDRDHLQQDLEQGQGLLEDPGYLIFEGNSLLEYVSPDLIFYLTGDDLKPKPSAEKARKKADIIINSDEYFSEKAGEIDTGINFNVEGISCARAQLFGSCLGIDYSLVGKMLNKSGIKVTSCQLGLF